MKNDLLSGYKHFLNLLGKMLLVLALIHSRTLLFADPSGNKTKETLTGNSITGIQGIFINELLASNSSSFTDESGDKDDWIEIYNSNSFPVNIAGLYITDQKTNPSLWQIPATNAAKTTIPANGFIILWADEETAEGVLHVNLKLGAGGEHLGIYENIDGTLTPVDSLTFGAQTANISYGRKPDGVSPFLFFTTPTPGTANTTSGVSEVLTPPVFSKKGGFYPTSFSLGITTTTADAQIRYTVDGSEPTVNSPVFTGTIQISSKTGVPNKISTIRTTVPQSEPQTNPLDAWYTPNGEVFKSTVVRAKVFKNGMSSKTSTHTYFIDPEILSRYEYPVISLAIDSVDLFAADSGIYVAGNLYDGSKWQTANFAQEGEAWEKPVHIEFYEPGGTLGFSQDAGVRIHGGTTTRCRIKSLRFYAKSRYGEDYFNYKLFPDQPANTKFKRWIIRQGGQDFNGGYMKDAMNQKVVKHLGIDAQGFRPAIVFINGEYWGIEHIMERVDEYYIQTNYKIAADSVDMLEYDKVVVAGDNNHYENMIEFMETHNLNDSANFAWVKTQMDVDNFINYYVTQIISNNTDWPQNNIKFWRKKTSSYQPDAPYGHDGRWRWVVYDMDAGFRDVTRDNVARATAEGQWYSKLIRMLLTNDSFKKSFINVFADQLNTTYKPGRVEQIITSFQTLLAPEMPEHILRWRTPSSIASWNGYADGYKTFANQRPGYVYTHVTNKFSLPGTGNITLNVSDPLHGKVKISTVTIDENTAGLSGTPYPWTGKYFRGNPVVLEAIAKPGYKFVKWSSGAIPAVAKVTVTINSDTSFTAIFEADGVVALKPAPFDLSAGNYSLTSWSDLSPAGTYPPNMLFVQAGATVQDPVLAEPMTDDYILPYNMTSKTRINGLGNDGFSFINTGTAGNLGAAVLALKTKDRYNIIVSWKAGTIVPNVRKCAIRLQYRIGDGSWTDVPGPAEYVKNDTAGHSKSFTTDLSSLTSGAVDNKSLIYLRWKYYFVDGTTGARPQLKVDDILVESSAAQVVVTANAGADRQLMLPSNSTSLEGSGSASSGSVTFNWTQVSGPSVATITNAGQAIATVSGLSAGNYVFRLTVSETSGKTATDDVNVNVTASEHAVISFTLINADNESDIKTITDGEVLNLATLPTKNLNVRANTNPAVTGSVKFDLNGSTKVESTAPYSLKGDNNGNYSAWTPALGSYKLSCTPYTSASAKGTAGTTLTVNFTVTNILGNQLPVADAGPNKTLIAPLNSITLTGKATDSDGTITSVTWTKLSGPSAVMSGENTTTLNLSELVQGTYIFRFTVADNNNAEAYDDVTVTVNPEPVNTAAVVSFTLINADTDTDIRTMTDGEIIDLTSLPTKNLNIRANTNPAVVKNVVFNLNGSLKSESGAPYALKGDNSGNYNAWTPAAGHYTLTGTPYVSTPSGTVAGTSYTIHFSVTNDPALARMSVLEDTTSQDEILRLNAYPNPFTDLVTIEFTTSKTEYLTLEIYNSKGKLVQVLFNGLAEAENLYRFEFDSAGLEGSFYYSRLTSKNQVSSQTLSLIR
jgi:hypothetical protein